MRSKDWHGAHRPPPRTLDLSGDVGDGIGRRGWRALLVALSGLPTPLRFLGLRGQPAVDSIGTAEQLDVSYCGLGGELVASPGMRRLRATGNRDLQAVAPLPESLEALGLSKCLRLLALPPALPLGLRELRLGYFLGAALPPLPAGLEVLDLSGCFSLGELPSLLPASLRELRLQSLGHLRDAVAQLQPLPRLEVLDLSHCQLEALPSLEDFPMLQELNVGDTRNAAGLYLPGLRKLVLGGELPERLHEFTALTELEYTSRCPPAFPPLPPGLQSLKLLGCAELRSMAQLPPRLTSLSLRGCSSLQSLPQLPAGLLELEVLDAPSVAIGELPRGLQALRLNACPFPDSGLPAGLRVLDLSRNPGLRLDRLDRLEELVLRQCQLTALPSAGLFPKLRVLNVSKNPELRLSADNWPDRLERLVVSRGMEVPTVVCEGTEVE